MLGYLLTCLLMLLVKRLKGGKMEKIPLFSILCCRSVLQIDFIQNVPPRIM